MRKAFLLNYLLLSSAVGLSVAYTPLFGGNHEPLIAALLAIASLAPFLVIFGLHFVNRPRFSFIIHHRIWAGALGYWVIAVVAAEYALAFGPAAENRSIYPIARVLIHSAWLAFVPWYGSWKLGWSPYGARPECSENHSRGGAV